MGRKRALIRQFTEVKESSEALSLEGIIFGGESHLEHGLLERVQLSLRIFCRRSTTNKSEIFYPSRNHSRTLRNQHCTLIMCASPISVHLR